MDNVTQRGRLFVVSAPSGAGKSTLCSMLIEHLSPQLHYSISYTTREPRQSEHEGIDYHFVTKEEFILMAEHGSFLEWAIVHGNYYGTSLSTIEKKLDEGYDILLDIDPQGASQLRLKVPDAVYIFITVPSITVLKERIVNRGSETDATIELRISNAYDEVECYREYDYIVINDDCDRAFNDLLAIYNAEHLRTSQFTNCSEFMKLS